jgi:hypothetical protein
VDGGIKFDFLEFFGALTIKKRLVFKFNQFNLNLNKTRR